MRSAGLDVSAVDMAMSLYKPRRNAILTSLLFRVREFQVACVLLVASICAFQLHADLGISVRLLGSSVTCGLWLLVVRWRGRAWLHEATFCSLQCCVEVQAEAIARVKPHVVVGSSWGGAVVAELLVQQRLNAPVVLLAPAWHAATRKFNYEVRLQQLAERSEHPIVVIHDQEDPVVSFADSVRIAETFERIDVAHKLHFIPVVGCGHRLLPVVKRGLLTTLVQAAASGDKEVLQQVVARTRAKFGPKE